jgi:hypothetical protein
MAPPDLDRVLNWLEPIYERWLAERDVARH